MATKGPSRPARLMSAPWVVPIATPPIADGAVVLDASDTVLAVGRRAELLSADVPEERADGALLPGLVNAHVHLELSALLSRVPGGGGLVDWAFAVMRTRGDLEPDVGRAA